MGKEFLITLILFLVLAPCAAGGSDRAAGESLEGHSSAVTSVICSRGGKLLISGSMDATVKIWDRESGRELAALISLENDEWAVVTPEGFFDGSPGGMSLIRWRIGGRLYVLEQYFNEFYYPGLLNDIYRESLPITEILKKRNDSRASLKIGDRDRRLPEVSLSAPRNSDSRHVLLHLSVKEAPADREHPSCSSGIKDLRLFRNGTLVKMWPGEQKSGTFDMEASVMAGENVFTAYAFNRDNIKSLDASAIVTGGRALFRQPRAYILSIGINRYSLPSFDLDFAVNDAEELAGALKKNLPLRNPAENVHCLTLLDGGATGEEIRKALTETARKAQPEDRVIVSFAGHGVNYQNRFYLLPHDLGSTEGRPLGELVRKGISEEDLERIMVGDSHEPGMEAQNIALILDCCHSGKVLESDDWRVGPMNSRGLAQLAWEKGMEILTASQSNQTANEMKDLKHGLLTYSLLEGFSRAPRAGGTLFADKWLEFAAREVPKISELEKRRGLTAAFPAVPAAAKNSRTQVPRLFHRRDRSHQWAVSGSSPEP